jgi:hypothetical protein
VLFEESGDQADQEQEHSMAHQTAAGVFHIKSPHQSVRLLDEWGIVRSLSNI